MKSFFLKEKLLPHSHNSSPQSGISEYLCFCFVFERVSTNCRENGCSNLRVIMVLEPQ